MAPRTVKWLKFHPEIKYIEEEGVPDICRAHFKVSRTHQQWSATNRKVPEIKGEIRTRWGKIKQIRKHQSKSQETESIDRRLCQCSLNARTKQQQYWLKGWIQTNIKCKCQHKILPHPLPTWHQRLPIAQCDNLTSIYGKPRGIPEIHGSQMNEARKYNSRSRSQRVIWIRRRKDFPVFLCYMSSGFW